MTLEDKAFILARDFGLELLLEQNDIEEEKVVLVLIELGLIDLDEYFYKDTEEAIWTDED